MFVIEIQLLPLLQILFFMFIVDKIRADFPILNREVHGKKISVF